jgi:predicted nucleotidyltransferase
MIRTIELFLHGGGVLMVNRSVVAGVRRYLRALQDRGVVVRFGIIFGSQARGEADSASDIDLLVVSPRFDRGRKRRDVNLLWRIVAHTDSRIEPVPCGEKQWEEDDVSPIIEIARREGRRIKVE